MQLRMQLCAIEATTLCSLLGDRAGPVPNRGRGGRHGAVVAPPALLMGGGDKDMVPSLPSFRLPQRREGSGWCMPLAGLPLGGGLPAASGSAATFSSNAHIMGRAAAPFFTVVHIVSHFLGSLLKLYIPLHSFLLLLHSVPLRQCVSSFLPPCVTESVAICN